MSKKRVNSSRLLRECRTIEAMTRIFCRKKHGHRAKLCRECQEILDYTNYRISKCPFTENKPTCKECSIHCFKSPFKEQVKEIMVFSGPRMMLRYPYLSLFHFLDKYRSNVLARKKTSST